jgi:hypothetical protein
MLDIIYTDDQEANAKKLKGMIDTEYKNSLGELNFEVRLVDINDFSTKEEAAAYYVFDASAPTMKRVISHATDTHRVCFGYNYGDFDKGILISLFVKERTYIYLNKPVFHNYQIKFTSIFYRIAKVVE